MKWIRDKFFFDRRRSTFDDFFGRKSTPVQPFEIVLSQSEAFDRYAEHHCKIVTARSLDVMQSSPGYRVGAFKASSGNDWSQSLADRLCQKLAAEQAGSADPAAQALAAAWFFVVWTELCTLVPIRHLARSIHRQSPDTTILVPCTAPIIDALGYWSANALEPLFLVGELQRRGARAFLFAPSSDTFGEEFARNSSCLTVRASPSTWHASDQMPTEAARSGPILCTEGIRSLDVLRRSLANRDADKPPRIFSGPAALLWGKDQQPQPIDIAYRAKVETHFAQRWSPSAPFPALTTGFRKLVGNISLQAWENAQRITAQADTPEVHICDHPFFTPALLAFAASQNAGHVSIWPHSTGPVLSATYRPLAVSQVIAATRFSQRKFARAMPGTPCKVVSQAALPVPVAPQTFDATRPINVVFFAGAHKLLRLPLCNIHDHIRTLESLFQGLDALPEGFHVLLKSKSIWESEDWLSRLLPPGASLTFTDTSTADLSLPNPVFMTASYGSSALLEGISKGIPALVARNIEIRDYTDLSADYGQVGTVEFILAELGSFADPRKYHTAVSRNLTWFDIQTAFDDL